MPGPAPASLPAAWTVDTLPPELEYFRTSDAYRVELDIFEGPLDLLLYLIQKDQVDVYDIPIARITDQFLQYLEIIQLLPLDNAGDFLVMAATLLRIKAQLLLPSHAEDEVLEEDPRAELVRRLLEYRRFKEAAEALREREQERRRYHLRSSPYPFLEGEAAPPPLRLDMFELLAALAGVMDRLEAAPTHQVRREPYTVEQKIALIHARLGESRTVTFQELFAEDAIKMEVVVTFIAVLELVKRGRIAFYQTEPRGPIWIRETEHRSGAGDDEAAEAAATPAAGEPPAGAGPEPGEAAPPAPRLREAEASA